MKDDNDIIEEDIAVNVKDDNEMRHSVDLCEDSNNKFDNYKIGTIINFSGSGKIMSANIGEIFGDKKDTKKRYRINIDSITISENKKNSEEKVKDEVKKKFPVDAFSKKK
jgi:hypothetical protein